MSFTPNPQVYPQVRKTDFYECLNGAGRENRTPTSSLARTRPTTKRYPPKVVKRLSARQARLSYNNLREVYYLKINKNQNVRPGGFEPSITVPKTVVISVSLRAHYFPPQRIII